MINTLPLNEHNSIRAAPLNIHGQLFSDFGKLEELLNSAKRILLKITSVFPFDFFPDEITIDECKVSIIFHEFFLSEDIHSIAIDMIKDIEVEAGPFFATLKIVPDGYPGQPLRVRFLKKRDAVRARKIIEGLIIVRRYGVDLTKLNNSHLDKEAELIGSTHLEE